MSGLSLSDLPGIAWRAGQNTVEKSKGGLTFHETADASVDLIKDAANKAGILNVSLVRINDPHREKVQIASGSIEALLEKAASDGVIDTDESLEILRKTSHILLDLFGIGHKNLIGE